MYKNVDANLTRTLHSTRITTDLPLDRDKESKCLTALAPLRNVHNRLSISYRKCVSTVLFTTFRQNVVGECLLETFQVIADFCSVRTANVAERFELLL